MSTADDARPELRTVEFTPAPRSLLDLELAEIETAAELSVLLDYLRHSQRNVEAWASRAQDGLSPARRGELAFVIEYGRRVIEWAEAELARYEGDQRGGDDN
ncbi:MAG TPA: hypothetical protein VK611_17045 [Acidimicrobiales bacterium]|nr:hypothetical protein [Acidimicrobiales bacterium]